MSWLERYYKDPKIFGKDGPLAKPNTDHLSGNFSKAVKAYDTIIKKKPNFYEAYRNRGLSLFRLQQYSKALRDFEQSLKGNFKDKTSVYYSRGMCYYKLKDYANAVEDFNKVLKVEGDHEGALNNRAASLMYIGKYPESVKDYSKLIRITKGSNFMDYYNRCIVNYKLKNYEKVIEDAKKVCESSCKDKQILSAMYYYAGFSHHKREKFDLAIENYTEAIKNRPDYHLAYNNRKKNENKKAAQDFEKATKLDPSNSVYANNLSLIDYSEFN